MTTPPLPDPTALATAQDLMDQLRIVECPFVRSLERVVTEYDNLVRRAPLLYRAPCTRPPARFRIPIDPEGLLDLLNRAHTAWRPVCATRTTAWQLALLLVAARIEVERVIVHRRSRLHPSRSAPGEWEADDASSWA